MKNIFIDEIAYKEFKQLLDDSHVESYNIRIGLSDYTSRGPIFNVSVDEPTQEDDTETVNEITFIINKELLSMFGGFIIASSEENNGYGVGLKPVVMPEGCGGCGGGCGESNDGGCSGCSGCH